jgi:twitching motility two-component system response regulator PilH
MQILIVDDVKTDRELVGRVVTSAGHEPIYASDGTEAINLARAHQPAMIFLDVVMAGMNGFNTCRELKKAPDTAGIPVVLVTSKNADSDKFWGRKQGADEYVSKPFTPDTILALIKRFTQR